MKTIEEYVEMAKEKGIALYIDPRNEHLGEAGMYDYDFEELTVYHNEEEHHFDSIKNMIEHRFDDHTCLKDYLDEHDAFMPFRLYGDQRNPKTP